ncbi:helix-turn-helix domain-containing protein [Microbispora sp. KK1-11]|uniref:helix-turn-helix domain-containing protein n=1 Tax=Microbispora sp. KK1-11 TaxID=2053005 RepID=UPI0011587F91|nr:helix-turn-helix transcriptional regulator [Microbispora sp. KK1-11]TQS30005.1 helix-turn-helix transcriptional regulator [Microbispora sp. KK1-11]
MKVICRNTRINPIIQALRDERIRRGWSQDALAARLYVHRTQISHWESGRCDPTGDSLVRWADALDMEITAAPKRGEAR